MNARIWAAAVAMLAVWTGTCRADECQSDIDKLGAQIPKLEVAGRAATDQLTVVTLKHPDAAALSLTCFNTDPALAAEFSAKWNAAWPPSTFYDVVASAGAIVASNTEPAVRSGAILCAQRALNAEDSHAVFDVNGVHFECTATSGVGQETSIRLSKLKDAPPPPQ